MFTPKRFTFPQLTGDWTKDGPRFVRAFNSYLLSLEEKSALKISQAQIYVDQGLQFPTTQVASSNANNLDDYEEGTWTPTVTTTTGAITTLGTVSGRYTKIGNTYLFEVDIGITTNGTGATAVEFTLPGGVAASNPALCNGREMAVGGKMLQGFIAGAGTKYQVVNSDNTYPGGDGFVLRISGFFT